MTLTRIPRAEFGEVFTRRWIVESILDLVGYTSDKNLSRMRLIEPSVGSGAFFVPVVERLVQSANAHGISLMSLGPSLRGYELQETNAEACRLAARAVLVDSGMSLDEAGRIVSQWIKTGDFLLENITEGADFVVGNPPYIRTEDLDDSTESNYRSRWSTMRGRADIYIGFYEHSLKLLNDGGKLGFICADRWMRNAYGKELRKMIASSYAMESVWQMHDVDAFETDVSAYPAITVIANKEQGPATFVNTTEHFGSLAAGEVLTFHNGKELEGGGDSWEGTRLPSWFGTSDFWPAGSPRLVRLLEHLQERFSTLEGDGTTKISIGVATGADKAYIAEANSNIDVEPDRLLPLVMANDIRGGYLKSPTKVMLNPWGEQGKLINLDDYPRFARTLGANEIVRERYVARKNPRNWHRTIDKIDPGLANKPKLLFQDMKAQITPVLEPGGYYPHHNLYYITSDVWDLEVLGGILLSRIAEAFISAYGVKMRGGTLRFQAQYLRKISVPSPELIAEDIKEQLRQAFRYGDREKATTAAELAYGLSPGESGLVNLPSPSQESYQDA